MAELRSLCGFPLSHSLFITVKDLSSKTKRWLNNLKLLPAPLVSRCCLWELAWLELCCLPLF